MNDKLQGSVATYSSCGGVVNNQKFERFIAECVSEKFFNIGEYLAKVTSKSVFVSCTLRAWPTHC